MRLNQVFTNEQMRELDRLSISEYGIPGSVLMENAGLKSFELIRQIIDVSTELHVLCFAGKGNNGGDAFVAARHLANDGHDVVVCLTGAIDNLKKDALINARTAEKMGIPVIELTRNSDLDTVSELCMSADLILDGIFGTGLNKPAKALESDLIEMINESPAMIVSLDIPSGLSADDLFPIGPVVRADWTITYGAFKPALLFYPAAGFAGVVRPVDISIPSKLLEQYAAPGEVLTPSAFPSLFDPRPRDAYKNRFGHVLVIAGSPGKTGAAVLAAESVLRAGAGLVTVAIPEKLNPILETKLTEVMTAPIGSMDGYYFDSSSHDDLKKHIEGKSVIVLGPGLGQSDEISKLVRKISLETGIPIVIDADGLNAFGASLPVFDPSLGSRVLTPHPGEMSRLLGIPSDQLNRKQLKIIPEFASSRNATIVYKTARTLVAFPGHHWYVNVTGNPGMATGGTGDVLSGLIGGFLSQGFSTREAVCGAVFLHGLAGDFSAIRKTEKCVCASDLIENLPQAFRAAEDFGQRMDPFMIPFHPLLFKEIDDGKHYKY